MLKIDSSRRFPRQKWSSAASDANKLSTKVPASWDKDYIRWLEDGDITLGTPLSLEIAARLRQLTAEPA